MAIEFTVTSFKDYRPRLEIFDLRDPEHEELITNTAVHFEDEISASELFVLQGLRFATDGGEFKVKLFGYNNIELGSFFTQHKKLVEMVESDHFNLATHQQYTESREEHYKEFFNIRGNN